MKEFEDLRKKYEELVSTSKADQEKISQNQQILHSLQAIIRASEDENKSLKARLNNKKDLKRVLIEEKKVELPEDEEEKLWLT